MSSSRPARTIRDLVFLLAPILVIVLVWLPVLDHYAVDGPAVTDAAVDAGRTAPTDAVLLEERDFNLLSQDLGSPAEETAIAEGILRGSLQLPGLPSASIGLPFSPEDLDGLPSSLQLWFAGYGVQDVLLTAYANTGRDEFLALARDSILAWDTYERSAWLNRGYLWNDHATAARVRTLGEFWRLYRARPDYQPEVGRVVLEQAARYRAFLADPGQYTFATNHGLMENLALLQLELAFPELPDSAQYRQLALDRLGEQLTFLVDENGVIRENSAGYQAFGLDVLAMTFRTMTLLGEPIPADWTRRYERGLAFLDRLERPDGTLPAVGDTDGGTSEAAIRVTDIDEAGASGPLRPRTPAAPAPGERVDPAAGYWIDWDGTDGGSDPAGLSQTVATWTTPPSYSHKHADELGVGIWSKGTDWLTGVGYWPYGEPGRAETETWTGANAPHLVGEAPDSARTASLVSSGSTPDLSAVDLERRGPGAYVARRQVVHVGPDLWVIVDHVGGDAAADHETVWTLGSDVTAQRVGDTGTYKLTTADGTPARLTFLGSPGTTIRDDRGSLEPFAGWQVVDGVPKPAPAMTVRQPPGEAWSVAILSTADPSDPQAIASGEPRVGDGSTADDWTITLPTGSGELTLTRSGGEVTAAESGGGSTVRLTMAPGPDTSPALASVRAAFEQVAAAYPQFQERSAARSRVTLVLLVLAIVQAAVLLGVRRIRPRLFVPLGLVSLLCWVAIGASLHLFVLRSWEIVSPG